MSTQFQQARAALRGNTATGSDAALFSRIGFWAGVSVVQLILCEFIVSATWRGLYSYRTNFVSELGVPFCGPSGNWPCSNLYVLMNASIALFGIAVVVASLAWLVTGVLDARGAVLLWIAGGGAVLAGVVDQATQYALHSFGATTMFILGSLGIIVAGGHRTLPQSTRITVTTLGAVALAATILYLGGHDFGLGIGTVERIVAYCVLAAVVVLAFAHRKTAHRTAAFGKAALGEAAHE